VTEIVWTIYNAITGCTDELRLVDFVFNGFIKSVHIKVYKQAVIFFMVAAPIPNTFTKRGCHQSAIPSNVFVILSIQRIFVD